MTPLAKLLTGVAGALVFGAPAHALTTTSIPSASGCVECSALFNQFFGGNAGVPAMPTPPVQPTGDIPAMPPSGFNLPSFSFPTAGIPATGAGYPLPMPTPPVAFPMPPAPDHSGAASFDPADFCTFCGGMPVPFNPGDYCPVCNGGGVPAVPEAETYALMLAGLGLVGFAVRRRGQR